MILLEAVFLRGISSLRQMLDIHAVSYTCTLVDRSSQVMTKNNRPSTLLCPNLARHTLRSVSIFTWQISDEAVLTPHLRGLKRGQITEINQILKIGKLRYLIHFFYQLIYLRQTKLMVIAARTTKSHLHIDGKLAGKLNILQCY